MSGVGVMIAATTKIASTAQRNHLSSLRAVTSPSAREEEDQHRHLEDQPEAEEDLGRSWRSSSNGHHLPEILADTEQEADDHRERDQVAEVPTGEEEQRS